MLEYLVCREAGRLRALQVISHGPDGLTDDFLRNFLAELAGVADFTVTGSTARAAYHADIAAFAGGSELMIYRKRPGEKIRAFVVVLH